MLLAFVPLQMLLPRETSTALGAKKISPLLMYGLLVSLQVLGRDHFETQLALRLVFHVADH